MSRRLAARLKSNQPGLFKEPWDVAVAPDGTIYVADTWNHRVQHFNADGAYLNGWGTEGNTDGQATGNPGVFFGPRGIAVDKDGRVLVSDTGNKRVQIFDGTGAFVSQFGGSGLQPGQLDEPVGIDTDAQGNIAVADTWNGRVQTFNAQGAPHRQLGDRWLAGQRESRQAVSGHGSARRASTWPIKSGCAFWSSIETGKYLGSFGQYGNGTTSRLWPAQRHRRRSRRQHLRRGYGLWPDLEVSAV